VSFTISMSDVLLVSLLAGLCMRQLGILRVNATVDYRGKRVLTVRDEEKKS
jgi:hypothetical protein